MDNNSSSSHNILSSNLLVPSNRGRNMISTISSSRISTSKPNFSITSIVLKRVVRPTMVANQSTKICTLSLHRGEPEVGPPLLNSGGSIRAWLIRASILLK